MFSSIIDKDCANEASAYDDVTGTFDKAEEIIKYKTQNI